MWPKNEIVYSVRVALCVAFEVMRRKGWMSQPELFFESWQIVNETLDSRQILLRFPLFGHPHVMYSVMVSIQAWGKNGAKGIAVPVHCSCGKQGEAEFEVKWDDNYPTLTLGEFTQSAPAMTVAA